MQEPKVADSAIAAVIDHCKHVAAKVFGWVSREANGS